MITHDSQIAFLIPDEGREKYFQWVDNMKKSCGLNIHNDEAAWNTYNDPIIIADRNYFSQRNWGVIATFMGSIGAKNVTDTLRNDDLKKSED
jgi:hypothetical protein